MRLKDFHETFKNDFQDREFALSYLQDCLEEGGITLFVSALKDIIKVYQVLKVLELDLKLQLSPSTSTVA